MQKKKRRQTYHAGLVSHTLSYSIAKWFKYCSISFTTPLSSMLSSTFLALTTFNLFAVDLLLAFKLKPPCSTDLCKSGVDVSDFRGKKLEEIQDKRGVALGDATAVQTGLAQLVADMAYPFRSLSRSISPPPPPTPSVGQDWTKNCNWEVRRTKNVPSNIPCLTTLQETDWNRWIVCWTHNFFSPLQTSSLSYPQINPKVQSAEGQNTILPLRNPTENMRFNPNRRRELKKGSGGYDIRCCQLGFYYE